VPRLFSAPSPAMVVACMALVISLGGAGYAAVKVTTKDIANGAVTGAKLKNDAVTGGKIQDRTISTKDVSPSALEALKGSSELRAYATVTSGTDLEAARTKGFTTLSRPAPGKYCLWLADFIDPGVTSPVVGVEWDDSSGGKPSYAYLSKSAEGCPDDADLGVWTFTLNDSGSVAASNSVAFTIAVP
jgi:hypothetical protein